MVCVPHDRSKAVADLLAAWNLRPDGEAAHREHSVIVPVVTDDGAPAVLKVSDPDAASPHEHLVLRRWAGDGAARLLRAEPHRHAVLVERLGDHGLVDAWDVEACEVVAGLYARLHVPAMPQLPRLSDRVRDWVDDLAALPRNAPIPRRLVERSLAVGRAALADAATDAVVLHGDLHYGKVLAADREPWLAVGPRPFNGDPHLEIVPMLVHRFDELAGDTRGGLRRRFWALVDAAELSDERARDWAVFRMTCHAMTALRSAEPDAAWLTTCVAVAKAVQD